MRLLFLSRWLPYPPDNGSKIRIFNLLRQLSSQYEVSLIAFDERPATSSSVPAELNDICASVQLVPYRGFRRYGRRALAGVLSRTPRFLIDTYRDEVSKLVEAEVRRDRPDVVVASQLDMLPYALQVKHAPLLLEELEITTYLEACALGGDPRRRVRAALTWLKLSAYLRRVLPEFACCTVASEQEAAHVRRMAPSYERLGVVPNAVDVAAYAGDFGSVEPNSMVFAGALTYRPNAEAARFLVDQVYPAVAARLPDARLRITGRVPAEMRAVLQARPGLELTGHVADVRPVVARSAAALAPLRSGGGTRLKILEAMALGTPVVATAKGAEGLDVQHERDILLADDAADFATAVLRVLSSPDLASSLARNARRLVETHYDWTVVGSHVRSLVESIAAPDSQLGHAGA